MTDELLAAAWLSEVDITPPAPLLLDVLHPRQHTVLFGDGGTGKGVVAAWWTARLTVSDPAYVVIILDYEQNASLEWAPRVQAFGGDLARVRVIQPDRAIWDAREKIAAEIAIARDAFPDAPLYMMVDSVTFACMGAPVENSDVATEYKHEIDFHGLPTLSLAHTTKANADPAHPFGSVFWSNSARLTIGISRLTAALDSPRVLRNKKTNQSAPFAALEIPWKWVYDDLPPTLEPRTHKEPLIDRAIVAAWMKGWMTLKEIVAAMEADGGEPFSADGVYAAVKADDRFEVDGPGGRGKTQRFRIGVTVTKSSTNSGVSE